MDVAISMENVFHNMMLRECKSEESKQWETSRHEIMTESIKSTIDYYAKYYYSNSNELENER